MHKEEIHKEVCWLRSLAGKKSRAYKSLLVEKSLGKWQLRISVREGKIKRILTSVWKYNTQENIPIWKRGNEWLFC